MNAGLLGGPSAAGDPGAYPVALKPGSAVIFNQASRHAHFGGKIPRRAILINYCEAARDRRHEYLLAGRIKTLSMQWGERMFSKRPLETAGLRRRTRIEKPM